MKKGKSIDDRFSPGFIERQKKRLAELRRETEEILVAGKAKYKKLREQPTKIPSDHHADAENTEDPAEKTVFTGYETKLYNIQVSLLMINVGTYGTCSGKDCGGQIEEKRLEALPTARLCIGCQSKKEGCY